MVEKRLEELRQQEEEKKAAGGKKFRGPPSYWWRTRAKKLIHYCGGDPKNPFHRGKGCNKPIERGEMIMRYYWWHKMGRGERPYHLDCFVLESKMIAERLPELPTIPRGRSTGRLSIELTEEQAKKRRSLLTQCYLVRKETAELEALRTTGVLLPVYANFQRRGLDLKLQSLFDRLKELGGKPSSRHFKTLH